MSSGRGPPDRVNDLRERRSRTSRRHHCEHSARARRGRPRSSLGVVRGVFPGVLRGVSREVWVRSGELLQTPRPAPRTASREGLGDTIVGTRRALVGALRGDLSVLPEGSSRGVLGGCPGTSRRALGEVLQTASMTSGNAVRERLGDTILSTRRALVGRSRRSLGAPSGALEGSRGTSRRAPPKASMRFSSVRIGAADGARGRLSLNARWDPPRGSPEARRGRTRAPSWGSAEVTARTSEGSRRAPSSPAVAASEGVSRAPAMSAQARRAPRPGCAQGVGRACRGRRRRPFVAPFGGRFVPVDQVVSRPAQGLALRPTTSFARLLSGRIEGWRECRFGTSPRARCDRCQGLGWQVRPRSVTVVYARASRPSTEGRAPTDERRRARSRRAAPSPWPSVCGVWAARGSAAPPGSFRAPHFQAKFAARAPC